MINIVNTEYKAQVLICTRTLICTSHFQSCNVSETFPQPIFVGCVSFYLPRELSLCVRGRGRGRRFACWFFTNPVPIPGAGHVVPVRENVRLGFTGSTVLLTVRVIGLSALPGPQNKKEI